MFSFLSTDKHKDGLVNAFGGLLPDGQGEDCEELDFANQVKKKADINEIKFLSISHLIE